MDADALKQWFDKHNHEYLKYDRIPLISRLHVSHTLGGLLKVASLLKDPAKFEYYAEHDVVYLADADDLRDNITEADVVELLRCGIHWEQDSECLADFT